MSFAEPPMLVFGRAALYIYGMADIIASIINHYKTKASTTLFSVYFSFWAIFHAEGLICLLFTSQELIIEKYGLLKNEYLFQYFFGFHPNDCSWWFRFVAPFLLTTIYVIFFARFVLNPAYKHDLKYKTDRKIMKAEEENRFQKNRLRLDKTLIKRERNKAEIEEAQKRQANANPHVQWDRDYQELSQKHDISKILSDLKELIYERNYDTTDLNNKLDVDQQSLAMCEAYGLVTRNERNWRFVVVTEKGWYFIRKHG